VLVAKFESPEYVALIVYAPFEGSGAEHAAVVTVPSVLTGEEAHKVTAEPPFRV